MSERKIYTLTQLNQAFERHVMKHFGSQDYWITAEIVKVNQKSGHFYLELADSMNDKTTAISSAVIWATTYASVVEKIGLKEVLGILQPGNKALLNVKLEYHSIYGLKINIRAIDPSYSYGEIERKRQEVIKKLQNEGIFLNQQDIRLPTIIKRIALIGSPETSGFRDFQNELFVNYDFNKFKVKIFPVSVQGETAIPGIVDAIKEANCYDVDVIAILRGGGSKMDLALFDDYRIAKEICLSRLPVLTGIGHETDEVVSDLVARQHFITPTAVGQFIQYGVQSFQKIMRELYDKTIQLSLQDLGGAREEFLHYNNYLTHYVRELIQYWKQTFREFGFEISEKSREYVYSEKSDLMDLSHDLTTELQRLLHREVSGLELQQERIFNLSLNQLERERINLSNQEELLALLNPLKILSAGFTISTIGDQDVRDVDVQIGDEMRTLASNSLLVSKIISKTELDHGNN
ncbi:MAG: exodeoxyribonuclease VII large subunit [Brumimicrobium sp.]|nr:exodeoxyribonuclease VII large subunit [Brumimicrobium sp.]MCO5269417.1 exodeoxyribonuclease VII large subunit [Brumimicrobium sp.]